MQDWLNTAVAGIRFRPDREKVEEELRGHFEDKVADLQRLYHLEREQAEEMALKQMGDAEEIGKEMARIHRPWWGYLWLLSKWAMISSLVWLFAILWITDDAFEHVLFLNERDSYMRRWVHLAEENEEDSGRLRALTPEAEIELMGYRFFVPMAQVRQIEEDTVLCLAVQGETWRFWELPELQREYLTFRDNEGRTYEYADYYEIGAFCEREDGVFWQLWDVGLTGFDLEAQWLEIAYDNGSTQFSLVVDLEVEG